MQSIASKIFIHVAPSFLSDYSKPSNDQFIFSYQVTINNASNHHIQLMARHWHIFDSNNQFKEVKGEGVIGKQPILMAGESFIYDSFCELKTDMGMMWGSFIMKDKETNAIFEVKIPNFKLIQDCRLN